jgi:polygalacturonase
MLLGFTNPTLFFIYLTSSCCWIHVQSEDNEVITCSNIVQLKHRTDNISLTDFGGVGDGKTLNTKAFKEAIYRISHLAQREGGTTLNIPSGVYLTEPFNLTSHMTLHLAAGAVIKATQVRIRSPLNFFLF